MGFLGDDFQRGTLATGTPIWFQYEGLHNLRPSPILMAHLVLTSIQLQVFRSSRGLGKKRRGGRSPKKALRALGGFRALSWSGFRTSKRLLSDEDRLRVLLHRGLSPGVHLPASCTVAMEMVWGERCSIDSTLFAAPSHLFSLLAF